MSSAFQREQAGGDIEGDLLERLSACASRIGVLLWDLVDERHGVVRFSDGTYVTRSVDVMKIPDLKRALAGGERLDFGSDRHFFAWQLAADRFVDSLRGLGLRDRTVVLAVPWAEQTTAGKPAVWSMGTRPREANAKFQRYYHHLMALGFRMISVGDPRSDPEHRWGEAPFHYAAEVYEGIAAQIREFAKDLGMSA